MTTTITCPRNIVDEVLVTDETRIDRSRSVSLRLVFDGQPAVYMTCGTRTSETRNVEPGGPGRQIEPHTYGPLLTFQDTRGGGLTREQWEAFKRAGDLAWDGWKAHFG